MVKIVAGQQRLQYHVAAMEMDSTHGATMGVGDAAEAASTAHTLR